MTPLPLPDPLVELARPLARMRQREMPAWLCRFAPAGSALAVFLAMSWLYRQGHREMYDGILQYLGDSAVPIPFLDISGWLAAWECARQGMGCGVVQPLRCLVQGIRFFAAFGWWPRRCRWAWRDTTAVGWVLDFMFIASLSLLPPPQRFVELRWCWPRPFRRWWFSRWSAPMPTSSCFCWRWAPVALPNADRRRG